jgi:hypothetical protein
MSRQELMELVAYNGHCSALVKLTADDLVVGHNTWADYDELVKSYKTFRFRFHHQSTRAQEVAFTSYPGFIWSSDDFVSTSGGSELLFLETTLTILDESLYAEHVGPEKGVMSWLRATVSGRMASDAKHWVELFAKHNSGTYNNSQYASAQTSIDEKKKEKPNKFCSFLLTSHAVLFVSAVWFASLFRQCGWCST